jgi:hypothetical protein
MNVLNVVTTDARQDAIVNRIAADYNLKEGETANIDIKELYAIAAEYGYNAWHPNHLNFIIGKRLVNNVYSVGVPNGDKVTIPRDKAQPKEPRVAKPTVAPVRAEAPVVEVAPSMRNYIPSKDETYIPFGEYRFVEKVVKSGRFFPVYITGESGLGKTTMVREACAKVGRPFIRVNLRKAVDESELLGSRTLKNGNVEVVYGPALIAMKQGAALLLDEIDAAHPSVLFALQSILEGGEYYFAINDEIIKPAHGFTIIATGNSKGKGDDTGRYIGLNVLNEAFLDRFAVTVEQLPPTLAQETKILEAKAAEIGLSDDQFISNLVRWADTIRKTYKDGGVDEMVSTRRLIHILNGYSFVGSAKEAVTYAVNRFDEETREAFLKLWNALSDEPVTQETNEAA